MPLTPAQEVAKAARIAKDREKLEQSLADPNLTDSRHIYGQLYEIVGSNPVTANAGSGAADVANGIDASADIEAIKTILNAIAANTATDKFEFALLEDSTGTVFYNKIDKVAGTVTSLTLGLATYTPVTPVTIVPPDAGKVAISTIYEAITTSGTDWTIGQQLRRVESWSLGASSNTLVSSAWINDDTGAILSVIPIFGTDVRGENDLVLDTLRQVSDRILELLTELGINADTTIPATNLDPATLKALIRRSNDLIEASSPIDTIGSTVDLSIPSNPTQPATLKGLDRGIWQTLLDTIVNTGDPSDTTIPATVNDPSTSKGIGRLAVSTLLNLITTITNRSQFTQITNGSIDLTLKAATPVGTDNAAVVSLSPNSAAVNLPTALLTDIAAIKTNTAKISQFSYQTAEDSAGTVFLIKTDTSTQVSTYINTTTGAIVTPGQVELSDPTSNGGQVEINEYTALTTSAGNWTPNQILTRIRIGNTATGAFTSTIWQKPDGTVLATAPVIDIDCEDTSRTLQTTATNTLSAIGSLVPAGTVVTGETIPSGSGFLGWSSWIAKQVVAILGKLQQGSQSLGTALSVTLARKTTIVGMIGTTPNLNMLDATGAGAPTDVRDYNSAQLLFQNFVGNTTFLMQGSIDAAFANPTNIDYWFSNASVGSGSAGATGANFIRYQINLAEWNYIRVNASSVGAGAIVSLIASQSPFIPPRGLVGLIPSQVLGTVSAVTTVGTVNNLPAIVSAINSSIVDIASATIIASATTAAITPTGGVSYQVEFDVTAITGADTVCILQIQESYNSGASWRTIYNFEPITQPKGARVYKSDLLPLTGNRIRYVQTITGTTPSITRQLLRTQSNLAVPTAIGTREYGGFNILDLPIYGRTRRILANNRTAAPLFLGVYAKNTALAAVDRPINGQIYLIPASGLSLTSVADWGEHGTVLSPESVAASVQVRLGVSSTFAQMTIPTGLGTAPNELFSLFVESV